MTKESKEKIRQVLLKRWKNPEYREKVVGAHLKNPTRYWAGKKRPDLKRNKKWSRLGKEAWNKGKKLLYQTDRRHWKWKGNGVGYSGLHSWIRRKLGKASHCEECGLSKVPKGMARYFQWANVSGQYKRILTDWKQLCVKCHKAFDGYGTPKGL